MPRPRSFDPDRALADIKDAFWRLGYEGASMQAIETATGLKKQSLYRLYGDKRSMYLKALARYEAVEMAQAAALLEGPGSPSDRIARLLDAVITAAVTTGDRRGCFLCNASVDQAQLDPATRDVVGAMVARVQDAFAAALASGPPFDADPVARDRAAAHVLAAYFGLRVLIKAGAHEEVLRSAATATVASLAADL